jgi:diacylglycerol kinase (ATP)
MRAAAILGPGTSMQALKPFQSRNTEIVIGFPATRDDLDAILIFGGDGTLHRHLRALVHLDLPVLVVPAGSGNDFARALGLRRVQDSLTAWRGFLPDKQNTRPIDLGVITPMGLDGQARPSLHPPDSLGNATYFSCAAGVGLDGEISRRANALPRWLRSHGGYALSVPAALLRFRPFVLHLSTSERGQQTEFRLRSSQPVTAAVFANTPVYGGGMKVAPKAQMDDGQLDICLIRDISKLKLLSVFPSVYFGRHLGIREVEYFPASAARLETERPLAVYADGEYVCQTPVQIGVAKNVLRVIVQG